MTSLAVATSPLRAARRSQRLTQEQVAEKLGTSKHTYWRFENGHGVLRNEQLRILAELLHLPPKALGLADDDNPPIRGDDLLRISWEMFFVGGTKTLHQQVTPLLAYLESRRSQPNLLVSRCYQAVLMLLRDQQDLVMAQVIADRAVDIARSIDDVDELAAALMRRSRVPIDALQHTTDPDAAAAFLQRAHNDAHAAAVLAPRCRPVLRAILLLNQGEIDARNGGSPRDVEESLSGALALSGTHAGTDEIGLVLHPAGVLHMRARAGLVGAIPLRDAEGDIINALELLPPLQNRWRADMYVTLAAIQAARGDSDGAQQTASTVTATIQAMKSRRIADRLLGVLARLPESKDLRTIRRELRWRD